MQQVLIETCADYDLTAMDMSKFSDALEDVLISLEDLVDINPDNHSVRDSL